MTRYATARLVGGPHDQLEVLVVATPPAVRVCCCDRRPTAHLDAADLFDTADGVYLLDHVLEDAFSPLAIYRWPDVATGAELALEVEGLRRIVAVPAGV